MTSVQEKFDVLVRNKLSKASFEDVKTVALAIWYDGFVPSVEHLKGLSAQVAGYIIDKLMRFNCVP